MDIREYLKEKKLICDGAFGTYYSDLKKDAVIPEQENTEHPKIVHQIHREYLKAGASMIRTNTFASNRMILDCDEQTLSKNIQSAYRIAEDEAGQWMEKTGKDIFVAADIGPVDLFDDEEEEKEYRMICQKFLDCGAKIFVFETFSRLSVLLPVIRWMKKKDAELFIIVQFCINQQGYTNQGLSAKKLLSDANAVEEIDAVGFNCGVGPAHMLRIMKELSFHREKYITALPNAGYPHKVREKIVFYEGKGYFAEKGKELADYGVDIIGGCCGTTPLSIKELTEVISCEQTESKFKREEPELEICVAGESNSFIKEGKKVIAVELSPPADARDEKILKAAKLLESLPVDVLTFPDSPSGRTRADSILMGVKVSREVSIPVMPHLCCRDKNAIAIRSQLLGAYMNGIKNALVITGDPVPTRIRENVKSVFNMNSVGFMEIMKEMNQEEFAESPFYYGGAVNHNVLRLDVEIKRVLKKMQAGAEFFMTQPVFGEEDIKKLRIIKKETGARIFCGIMPLISYKNAIFMKNEMTGINVPDSLIAQYDVNMNREEGEEVGIRLAKKMMELTEDFIDGYYFSIPFNRVYLLQKILGNSSAITSGREESCHQE